MARAWLGISMSTVPFYSISSATYTHRGTKKESQIVTVAFFFSFSYSFHRLLLHRRTHTHSSSTFSTNAPQKQHTHSGSSFIDSPFSHLGQTTANGETLLFFLLLPFVDAAATGTAHDITNIPGLRYQIEECIIVCY